MGMGAALATIGTVKNASVAHERRSTATYGFKETSRELWQDLAIRVPRFQLRNSSPGHKKLRCGD
jgi:hypothetical protein